MQQLLFQPEKEILNRTRYEYLIILSPNDDINQSVKEWNSAIKLMLKDTGWNHSAKAHITLIHYISFKETDELYIAAVKNVSKIVSCFSVHLKGFDYFEHGRKANTLYISITNKDTVANLCQSLAKELSFIPTRYFPHITIAKSFPKEKLSIIKNYFEKIKYENEFICDKIIILKKKIINNSKSKYESIFEAPLFPYNEK